MALNTLSNIMPKILARGLLALRERVVMPRLVNGGYGTDAAQKGDTIDIPLPVAQEAAAIAVSNTPPVPAHKEPTKVQIQLDQWFGTNFHLTDKDLGEVSRNETFFPMQASEAVRSLANQVNQNILSHYTGIYGTVGAAGADPFAASASLQEIAAARRKLNEQLCPREERRCVINHAAEENAIQAAPFRDASQSGSTGIIVQGEIGRKLGFDWYADDHIPTHTTQAAGTILVDQADVAIGDTGAHFDGGTTTAKAGDVFTVDGDDQQYVIKTATALTGTDFDVTFEPAAKVAWADDAAVTFIGAHAVNLAFHRDAFAFVNRPLAIEGLSLGNNIISAQDPVSGLTMRLEVSRQYKQTVWEFDMLWGAKLIRPELACRIIGAV